jgi:hypothetical protein
LGRRIALLYFARFSGDYDGLRPQILKKDRIIMKKDILIAALIVCLLVLFTGCDFASGGADSGVSDSGVSSSGVTSSGVSSSGVTSSGVSSSGVTDSGNDSFVKADVVEYSADEATITYTNTGKALLLYGLEDRSLQVFSSGRWDDVPQIYYAAHNDGAYHFESGESFTEKLSLKRDYGALGAGRYRVIRNFSDADLASTIEVFAEFVISDSVS